MIVRGSDRVLVQGITGKQGTFWTERMQEYGTRVVGGVNPRKAGTQHCGVPVHASAKDAMEHGGFDVTVLFIPPMGCKAAALDAIEAGCRKLVVLTEHIPVQDVMYVMAAAPASWDPTPPGRSRRGNASSASCRPSSATSSPRGASAWCREAAAWARWCA